MLFFLRLTILSKGELLTDKTILVDIRGGASILPVTLAIPRRKEKVTNYIFITLPPSTRLREGMPALSDSTFWCSGKPASDMTVADISLGILVKGMWGVGIFTGAGSTSLFG